MIWAFVPLFSHYFVFQAIFMDSPETLTPRSCGRLSGFAFLFRFAFCPSPEVPGDDISLLDLDRSEGRGPGLLF